MLLSICSIYTLAYVLRNLSGPFNIFDWVRRKLLGSKHFGVFFYGLLSCPWCFGFHCGWLVYLISTNEINIRQLVLWGLTGSLITFIGDQITGLTAGLSDLISNIATRPNGAEPPKDEKSI